MNAPQSYDTLVAARHQILQDLISAERALIGYIYPHAPLELFIAHDLSPTLLWAEPKVPGSYEASLQTFCCAYSRNLFSQRSKERLPPLTAIVFPGGTCDSLQNLGDVWRARFPEDIVLRLTYPVANDDAAITFLAEELRNLSHQLEVTMGTRFSMKKYQEAVALIAEFRAAAQFITTARILQPSIYPYLEYARLIRRFLTAPNAQNLQDIETIATQLQTELRKDQLLPTAEALRYGLLNGQLPDQVNIKSKDEPRVMLMGGMVDPEGIALHFENAKNNADLEDVEIVFDLLSFTFRTVFAKAPDLHGDPYFEMAKSILTAPAEPTQEGLPSRLNFIDQVFTKLHMTGLILCEQSFCDPDQFEVPDTLKLAEKKKLLAVRVPLDPEFSDRARLEGRLQSFLETLTAR
jgi:benzoyl-CoA reductase/2-hydroxyglutaryl-CoA dehydratase subunit BcrC/BadD/HgdB